MIEPKSFENPKLKELIRVLMDWINDELHTERIIVQVIVTSVNFIFVDSSNVRNYLNLFYLP